MQALRILSLISDSLKLITDQEALSNRNGFAPSLGIQESIIKLSAALVHAIIRLLQLQEMPLSFQPLPLHCVLCVTLCHHINIL